ncbi:MAG: ribosomal RNA small subunit methyltransferase A [Parcubacteria group bacterium]|nr:ribosomal RNA small subunit methyltransferase A [Parcubacteria group bacterium]
MSTPHLKNTNYHCKSREARYFSSEGSPLKPKKRLGQVFLKKKSFLQKIIQATEIKPNDLILEIGPGTGVLTAAILQTGAKVIAIEKDPRLVKFLENRFKNTPNLQIIQGDIRDILNPKQLSCHSRISGNLKDYKVVGNIPYYLTSHLIQLLLELKHQPKVIVFMVQKEVAQRIVAQPPQMNLLTVSVQFYAQPKIICFVPKSAFWPQPKVDSAIIKLSPRSFPQEQKDQFFKIIKAGFSHPRKLLISNLSQNLKMSKKQLQEIFFKLNLPLNIRAQNLTLKDWLNLTNFLFA